MKKYTMIVFVLMFFISCNPQIKRITKTSENNEFDNSKTDVLFCENEIKIDKDNVSDFFIFDEMFRLRLIFYSLLSFQT